MRNIPVKKNGFRCMCVLLLLAGAAGAIDPVWHSSLENDADTTNGGGTIISGPTTYLAGYYNNAFAGNKSVYGKWSNAAVATIFDSVWVNSAGSTVDLYFRGDHWSTHTGDSGLWGVVDRYTGNDGYIMIAVRDGHLRFNYADSYSGYYNFPHLSSITLANNVTYRLTVRQLSSNFEVYLDGGAYSNTTPVYTTTFSQTISFPAPNTINTGDWTQGGRYMAVGNRPVFGGLLQSGEWVDEISVYNGYYTPAELGEPGQSLMAWSPDPGNGASNVALNTDLSWNIPVDANETSWTYEVYLDTDSSFSSTSPIAAGPLSEGEEVASVSSIQIGGPLSVDTYYWRVDSIDNDAAPAVTHTGDVWSFDAGAALPVLIAPVDGYAAAVEIDVNLEWSSDPIVDASRIIITPEGESPIDLGEQTSPFNPYADTGITMEWDKKYSWQVIELDADDNVLATGAVWKFRVTTMNPVVRIMPCGDSITYDNYSGDARPTNMRTAYRNHLWYQLHDAGYHVDFVGSVIAGEAVVPAFDPDNEGHPGWRDDQVAASIYGWLEENPADIILLHIGTNALSTSPDDVENILDEIDQYESDYSVPVTVVLAKIINRATYSSTTTTFNTNVSNMAQTRINNDGDDIVIVDMEDGAGINYSTDMQDDLHPNNAGYQKMANLWFSTLQSLLPDDLPLYAEIDSPANGTTVYYGEDVALSGSGYYGSLPYVSYDWSSDIDGHLGSGSQITISSLSVHKAGSTVQPHTITLTVEDANSVIATAEIDLTVLFKGDFEPDGDVDLCDYAALANEWLAEATDPTITAGWWKLDEQSGTIAADSSGSNHAGTLVNMDNSDWVAGKYDNALDFDGVNDYVTIARSSVLETGNAATRVLAVSAWVKSDYTSAPANYSTVAGTGDGGWLISNAPGGNTLFFACWLLNGGAGQTAVIANTTAVFDGGWHHIVGIFDGSSVHLYVDGNHAEGATIGGTIRNMFGNPVLLGENAGATGRRWDGLIDDVRIYDYVPVEQLNFADLDEDGTVNIGDLAEFAENWLKTGI